LADWLPGPEVKGRFISRIVTPQGGTFTPVYRGSVHTTYTLVPYVGDTLNEGALNAP
jgi:hypothetical protein